TNSSGNVNAFQIAPTFNQTSTAGFTVLDINPTLTATGSGTKLLTNWRTGSGSSVASVDTSGNFSSTHYIGASAAPTIAAGAGAGTSPTISIAGTDLSCTVTLTTGTLPSISSPVCTVTFAGAYGAAPRPQMTPGNGAAASLSGLSMVYPTTTTTTMVLNSDTTALTAATQYVWYFTF